MKSTAFIASASERRDVAYTVQEILEQQDIEVTVWDEDVIQPSSSVLDGLIQSVHRRNEPLLLLRLVAQIFLRWNRLADWLRETERFATAA